MKIAYYFSQSTPNIHPGQAEQVTEQTLQTLDRLPVSSLVDRYNIGRTALYERISALSLKPSKEAGRSFLDAESVAQLDALATHLRQGGTTPEFVRRASERTSEQPGTYAVRTFTPDVHPSLREPGAIVQATPIDLAKLLTHLQPQPAPIADPLQMHRWLEEIAQHRWIFTTPQLRAVLGHAPVAGDRYGFSFAKVGQMGRSAGWKVTKNPAL